MPTRPLVIRYEDDLVLFPGVWHRIGLTLALVLLFTIPFVASPRWLTVSNLALVSIVGAVGLMVLTGFAGQISLGHAAFLAVGAYTVAILGEQWHLPFWLALPLGGLTAALVGLAVGPFALRLEGLYLAIVTLGLLYLVTHLLHSMPSITHGVSGIAVPMHGWFSDGGSLAPLGSFSKTLQWGPLQLTFERKIYFLFLVLAASSTWFARNLRRSATGRAMIAVRDHDLAAEVLGVSAARTKIIAFGLSSFLAGVAGGMFAFQQQYITIDPPFDLNMSVHYIAIIVLGGIGTVFGAVAGAIAFVALGPLADAVGHHVPLLAELSSAQRSNLLFASVVIAFLVFEPLGLYGVWLRIQRYFVAWPFRH